MLALPRTSMLMAMEEAEAYLAAAEPWSAWRVLHPYLEAEEASASAILLGARAAAALERWEQVHLLLSGREWLARVDRGAGLELLARANEEGERWSGAAAAYRQLARYREGRDRARAEAKLAQSLVKLDRTDEAARFFASAAEGLPEVADWLRALEAEAMAAAGRPDARRIGGAMPAGSSAARLRRARAHAAAWLAAGDSSRAVGGLRAEVRVLYQQGATREAADLAIDLARHLRSQGESGEARELLRAAAWEGTLPQQLRLRAANQLGEISGSLTPSEEMARAGAYEAAGRAALAARSLRAAVGTPAAADPEAQLRLGRLLFEAGDHRAAREQLLEVAERLQSAERAAEAELYAARARFRSGDKAGGLAEMRRLTERRGGTRAAGTAWFLLGDAAPKIQDAIPLYQRAASITSAPEAREALSRLADRRLRNGEAAAAARAWEEYVARYPTGEETARIAYTVGLSHERAGRVAKARELYRAGIEADPLSYFALRAAERLKIDPFDRVLAEPRPWIGLASDAETARDALVRLDLLHGLGLLEEWAEELGAVTRRLEDRLAASIVLAEGLRDGGHTLEAIRLGRSLLTKRGGEWDERLLRVVFPLPYRGSLMREAARHGVEPMLIAGLIRQESMFRPAVRSRVGATGLAQIMPATGRWIAPRLGIDAPLYDDDLLKVPEINLRMGALYLGDLLRRYGGARDLALAGYNAGPARADRWRRELGYERDIDAFREAIPFHETRHYVRIVLRNAAVYERLYGAGGPNSPARPRLAAE